jgi:hypothetical protein
LLNEEYGCAKELGGEDLGRGGVKLAVERENLRKHKQRALEKINLHTSRERLCRRVRKDVKLNLSMACSRLHHRNVSISPGAGYFKNKNTMAQLKGAVCAKKESGK